MNFDESETEEEEEEEDLPTDASTGKKEKNGKYYNCQTSLNCPNTIGEDDFENMDHHNMKGLSLQIDEQSDFANSIDVPELEMYSPDILDEEEDDYEPHPTLQEVTVSQGKSFLLDFEPVELLMEEGGDKIDIDLTDPAVEAAATKIQSVFKGFRARKSLQQKSLQL